MKISNLWEWCSENFPIFIIIAFSALFIGGIGMAVTQEIKLQSKFPEGTDVIVKGTEIHGTVTKWAGKTVYISYVEKDGTVKTVSYDYNLLKKQ